MVQETGSVVNKTTPSSNNCLKSTADFHRRIPVPAAQGYALSACLYRRKCSLYLRSREWYG